MTRATRSAAPRLAGAALPLLALALGCSGGGAAPARNDSPMFGGTPRRNLANDVVKGLPADWSVQKGKEKNVRWSAGLGTTSVGGPVIAGGRIYVGTNNEKPRDPAVKGDKGVVMCFNEADGKFLWQIVHDKLPGTELDAPKFGVASSPVVDGSRVYYVSNRCELVCADAAGDPAKGEGKILWSLDMIKELKVYPGGLAGGLANCSPLVVGDLVYVVTSNGADSASGKPPSPEAPSFLAVDKNTGKVAWQSNAPGEKILDGQWGSPAAAEVNGKTQVIFPGGDGWLYAFEAKTGELLWKFDCNPKAAVFKAGGRGDRNYLVATPVVVGNLLYVAVGQEPDSGSGVGHLWCVDISKGPANPARDLSPADDNFDPAAPENKNSGLVWHYGGPAKKGGAPADRDYLFGRTVSTVAVHDGLVYAAELEGFLHCLDAKTGQHYWEYDLKDGTWSSPYYADGKVYLGTEGGDLFVFAAGKEKKEPAKINLDNALKAPPAAANGVLYVTNGTTLYAVAKP
jgi:outer membrane protein assembly factor BamB